MDQRRREKVVLFYCIPNTITDGQASKRRRDVDARCCYHDTFVISLLTTEWNSIERRLCGVCLAKLDITAEQGAMTSAQIDNIAAWISIVVGYGLLALAAFGGAVMIYAVMIYKVLKKR